MHEDPKIHYYKGIPATSKFFTNLLIQRLPFDNDEKNLLREF